MATDTSGVRKDEPVNTPGWKIRLDPDKRRAGIRAANAAGSDLASLLKLGIDAIIVDARAFVVACQNIIREEEK